VKAIIAFLALLLILLQIRLWTGEGSFVQVYALKKEVNIQQEKLEQLKVRNETLLAEVQDLKHRLGALEERARTDLGMVKQGETFYQFANKDDKS
jgi:cell division protein FtsB